MNIIEIMQQVVSLFLIILVGVYGSKKKIISEDINKGLTDILTKITLPLMVIASFNFQYNEGMQSNVIKAFIYSVVVLIISILISKICLMPIKSNKKKILQFANVFSNCGFMGFPVIESIYGSEGIIYASIFNMFFALLMWTYGVMLFTSKISLKDMKKVLLNPGIVSVYIGMVIMVFKIQIPNTLYVTIKSVGSITTPLSMIVIGVILSKVNIYKFAKDITILYGSIVKLIIIPLGIYFVSVFINDSSKVMKTMIILQAMPAAAMTSIFAENFSIKEEYSAVVVFVTTMLSIITFPIILKIVM